MEPEIAHPVASCSTTLTPNKATTPEANGVEQYEGVVNNNNVDNKNKGKAIQLGDDDEQLEGSASDCYDTTNNDESYPGSSPLSNSLLDPDSLIYEDDDDYSDQYGYEMEDELEEENDDADDYVSEYQALFDAKEKDIPAGVEVTMDWLPNSETAKSSGSGKCSRDEHGIKPEAPSSSSKKATMGSGIHSTPVAQPWNALPHNSKGVIPNSAYALPLKGQTYHYSAQALKFSSDHLEPQTPDTVMGDTPAPAPASASASSGLVLPVPNNPPWFKGHKMYPSARPRVEDPKKVVEVYERYEAVGDQFLLVRNQMVENDRERNGNREALTALRKKARTTKTSVPSPFDSMMKDTHLSSTKTLVQEVCSTCGSHDSSEPTWMMLPGTDLFAAVPFHAVHTMLEKDEKRMEFESKKLQSLLKEKTLLLSELGALADSVPPSVIRSLITLKDKP